MKITRFEDIEAWKVARSLVGSAYGVTSSGPFSGDTALRKQMIRCAASAMANIAEGFDSGSDPEFIRFLRIAQRSATEFQSHLYIASDRGYLDSDSFESLYGVAASLKRLIGGFIRHLKRTRKGDA